MLDTSYPSLIQTDINLQPYNTLNISARAKLFASIESEKQLKTILNSTAIENEQIFVLGGGSNILFADDFDGLIIHVNIKGREIVRETDEHIFLRIGAGENWHELVRYCVEQGWGGIENLSLIPGMVGAAPIQNIGAYGAELKDVFVSLDSLEINSGNKRSFNKDECRFGYRDSIFKNELKGKVIVTAVVLKLSKYPEINTSYGAIKTRLEEKGISDPGIREISDTVIEIRNSKLPNPDDIGNAGSFFKNPVISEKTYNQLQQEYPEIPGYQVDDHSVKVPAGWLIEETGWKGKIVGNAGTYKQQALVIVNHGGASGNEILELADAIRASVKDEFGIELVPEVNIID